MGTGDLLYFSLRDEPAWWVGLTVLVAATVLATLARGKRVFAGAGLAISLAALGFAAAQLATYRAPAALVLPRKAVLISGVLEMVEKLPAGQRITVAEPHIDDAATSLGRTLRIKLHAGDITKLQTGDTIRVRAIVSPPSPPAYPGGWDLQRDAWYSGLGGYGYALDPVERIASHPGFTQLIELLREHVAARVAEVLPGSEGAIAATLLTGMTADIPAQDREAFRDAGLSHLLAIAGLHVGIVMGLLMGGTRFGLALSEYAALNWPIKHLAAMVALLGGAGYMLLTGMHVPIIRSFAMAGLATAGILVGRRAISLRGLSLAGGVIILVLPEQLVGVSMQMSFAAVLALIAGYAALRPHLQHLGRRGSRRLPRYMIGLALTSLLAGAASAPFAAYHFGHIQLYFVTANMLAVPLTAIWVMPAGLVALALMPFGLDRSPLVLMGLGVHIVLWIGREVSSWPAASLQIPRAPDWGIGVLALGMVWMGLWRSRLRLAGAPLVVVGMLAPLAARPPDLLVSADAKLIAVRTARGAFAQAKSDVAFTRNSWEQLWRVSSLASLEEGQIADPSDIACSSDSCFLRSRIDGPAALLIRGAAMQPLCEQAQLIVSSDPLPAPCRGFGPIIDRFTVWRDGAEAVWLSSSGVEILSDRTDRGSRPWVVPTPPRLIGSTLPSAKRVDQVN
jgi:competence protein ComEC